MTILETILLCLNVALSSAWIYEYKHRKRLESHPLMMFEKSLRSAISNSFMTVDPVDPIGSLKIQMQEALEREDYETANRLQEEITKLEASK